MNLFTPAEFTENYAQAGVKKASLPLLNLRRIMPRPA